MSNIDIRAHHEMNSEDAQWAADDLAQDLAERFDIDYGWEDDVIHFDRPGVRGKITFEDSVIHIQAKLGVLLAMLKTRIEEEIVSHLGEHFGCRFDR